MQVIISFGGLMAFIPDHSSHHYENVAILTPASAPGHVFGVSVDGVPQTLPEHKSRNNWSLAVTGRSAGVRRLEVGHDLTRMSDDGVVGVGPPPPPGTGQYDMGWMVDLSDYHSGLKLRPDAVNPIIELQDGVLYSLYKTDQMEKRIGSGRFSDFGFMTETVGLSVEVRERETLVLKDNGTNLPIFSLPYDSVPVHEVTIKNIRVPNPHPERSDFRCYYQIFDNDIGEQYQHDFQIKEGGRTAHNRYPRPPMLIASIERAKGGIRGKRGMRGKVGKKGKQVVMTCCGMDCSAISLSHVSLVR